METLFEYLMSSLKFMVGQEFPVYLDVAARWDFAAGLKNILGGEVP